MTKALIQPEQHLTLAERLERYAPAIVDVVWCGTRIDAIAYDRNRIDSAFLCGLRQLADANGFSVVGTYG